MASSAQQGFVDPYSFTYTGDYNAIRGFDNDANSKGFTGESGIPGFFGKLIGFDSGQMKALAEKQADIDYERASINSARAWSEYLENTQYQRRVEDLKKAGLNPWLAVQNGINGSGSPSVDTGGSAKNQTKSDQSMSFLATLLMAIAKIFA